MRIRNKNIIVISVAVMILITFIISDSKDEILKQNSKNVMLQEYNSNIQTVRLMTYNIRHGVGMDKNFNIDRIIELIRKEEVDIISLNEVDKFMHRSRFKKQAQIIAEKLGYNYVFGRNFNIVSQYGNAIITKYPIKDWKNYRLPVLNNKLAEQRGLLKATLNIQNKDLTVMSTHLSLVESDRVKQADYIIQKLDGVQNNKILMGDFNAVSTSDEIKKVSLALNDTSQDAYATYPSINANKRIDYIFISNGLNLKHSYVLKNNASDHLPVVAEITIP